MSSFRYILEVYPFTLENWAPTQDQIRNLLRAHPWLGISGDLPGFEGQWNFHREDECRRNQNDLIRAGNEIAAARYYISLIGRTKSPGYAGSYWWKHQVESFFQLAELYEHTYCSNGAFIAACLLDGVQIKRNPVDPNPLIRGLSHARPGTKRWKIPRAN